MITFRRGSVHPKRAVKENTENVVSCVPRSQIQKVEIFLKKKTSRDPNVKEM